MIHSIFFILFLLNLYIALFALPVSQQDFRGTVLERATERVELLSWLHVGCTAKVYQFEGELPVNNDILILQQSTLEGIKSIKNVHTYIHTYITRNEIRRACASTCPPLKLANRFRITGCLFTDGLTG